MSRALLVLADGSVFEGNAIGVPGRVNGEVVFDTAMTGYQEMLTDPSFAGQLLTLTYPMIGNYGFDDDFDESARIQPAGLIVREAAAFTSHPMASGTLDDFLRRRGVTGISGVDTRAITRRIRRHGVMLGTITHDETPEAALDRLGALPSYDDVNWVESVTSAEIHDWDAPGEPRLRVALLDVGVKRSIMRALTSRGCAVRIFPASIPVDELLEMQPDGILLSPGPGDPRLLDSAVEGAGRLIGRVPVFGICLGHQVIARALGAGTFKLPFGHRGGNHPVQDTRTGVVTITSQNHGYSVDADYLDSSAYVSHISLNDRTVEGIALKTEPVMTIQYHAEACPGPLDSDGLFDRFVAMMSDNTDRSGGRR